MTYCAISNIQLNLEKTQQIGSQPLETSVLATDNDLVALAEKLSELEVPLKVLLQALAIAAYDKAAAYRYADNYLNNLKKQEQLLLESSSNLRDS
ncbi:hypothetical protein [Dendronalium phyllosphericum]|uniref:hypothetical protein n=1 Tax=Dendronalium phyllosphericum TaxID=2840445 RepID=UPI001CEDE838|nr:hypothetical protein [Dendronalium phyllosphericum]